MVSSDKGLQIKVQGKMDAPIHILYSRKFLWVQILVAMPTDALEEILVLYFNQYAVAEQKLHLLTFKG